MPANTAPIFSILGAVEFTSVMSAANTGHVSGSTSYLVFTGGTNGSYLQKIRFRHLPNTSVANANATVARVWINNGSAVGTPANSTLFDEITIAANTTSSVAASTNYELPLNFAVPPNYAIYVTLGTAPTSGTYIQATCIGGDY
jgi:hypothetical protein